MFWRLCGKRRLQIKCIGGESDWVPVNSSPSPHTPIAGPSPKAFPRNLCSQFTCRSEMHSDIYLKQSPVTNGWCWRLQGHQLFEARNIFNNAHEIFHPVPYFDFFWFFSLLWFCWKIVFNFFVAVAFLITTRENIEESPSYWPCLLLHYHCHL